MCCSTIHTERKYIQRKRKRRAAASHERMLISLSMGDLIGFEGYLNESTPFTTLEHHAQWKTSRRYLDFHFGNTYNTTCDYPRFYNDTGYQVIPSVNEELNGCYNSEFDQYGDTEAFGVFPDWQRQLSKFASVQDRLREWVPSVRSKIENFSCMVIAMLDIDGFRFDKATQATVDALGISGNYLRACAREYNKTNFFLPGEITGGNTFGAVYLGRGRSPGVVGDLDLQTAMSLTNYSEEQWFIRDHGYNALDAAAFHYSVYRALTRFLGLDGTLTASYDTDVDWVLGWNETIVTNDLVNANTGVFDPRHMYGVSNQDLFRWPAITNGTERQLLGSFITTLHLPGIPLLLWGEEQNFYILDNTASNYLYGRQSMTSATSWQMHGCYSDKLGSDQYYHFPLEAALKGCEDDTQSLDRRDPTHPIRNVLKAMFQMRDNYPVLLDGFYLEHISNSTTNIYYPGSGTTPTETGIWSRLRGWMPWESDAGNGTIWLVYQNVNRTVDWTFDCSSTDAFLAPFAAGTTVRNLFYPYENYTLASSGQNLGLYGSDIENGCLSSITLEKYGFRAFVPLSDWVGPGPMMTNFTPGHDYRYPSTVGINEAENIDIAFYFSEELDCDTVTSKVSFTSTTLSGVTPSISGTPVCTPVAAVVPDVSAGIPGIWKWTATLQNVYNGVHRITVNNASNADGSSYTNAVDHVMFRVGQVDNPMVFHFSANYSNTLLEKNSAGDLIINHKAAGADKFRYSTNWASSWSGWQDYTGENTTVVEQAWSGTKLQKWKGKHIRVEYWSKLTGSSNHVQEGDYDWDGGARRFPHIFWNGPYNQYGYDAGLVNHFTHNSDDNKWQHTFSYEWPAIGQINVWGMNPDQEPDQTIILGDADIDGVLDRLPPSSLSTLVINITTHPPSPYLAWKIVVNDANYRYTLLPVGSQYHQMPIFFLLWIIPVITGALGIYGFMKSFYQVKFNQIGVSEKSGIIPLAIRRRLKRRGEDGEALNPLMKLANKSGFLQTNTALTAAKSGHRRMVLIATMEYDIEDWGIKIKIGGLGVMAQLMGKNLGHQDLIWVVPCVGGVDYPMDQMAEPMSVTVLGNPYEVQVQYHVLRNITYVLLDAPVFRQQSKSEPYPPRMDDLDSAIYYSAWNQCIALAIKRFPIDLYHINDYHGSLAPLYLFPDTIPACLSLHNAEFQGLWPVRTQKEREEVCAVFNIDPEVARRYVQFGEVFNLLHAGASYLRVHQQGFGAVGVSKKYGKRSFARYPIFWGLKKVGNLPNPDPSDTGEWNKEMPKDGDIRVDPAFEANRGELKRQAQEWAGLDQNPNADLLVFVGRWSMQKGVDLIADVFPSVLEQRPNVQLICVGPVIDLYGKFAALKLNRMMELFPGRVFSKPQFTALPPFIFSGAEFALIPSRDEPFGLVAVEFGRKGALGIGARVGGLGQMPGWWYTVESTTTTHLLHQFRLAIEGALNSKQETRAMMRARSAKQRFPVAQWVEDLEILQSTAIRIHKKETAKAGSGAHKFSSSGMMSPMGGSSGMYTPPMHSRNSSYANLSVNRLSQLGPQARNTIVYTRDPSPEPDEKPKSGGLSRQLSLGVRAGPGHLSAPERRGRRKLRKSAIPEGPESPNPNVASMAFTDYDDDSDDEGIHSFYGDDEYTLTPEQAEASRRLDMQTSNNGSNLTPLNKDFLSPRNDSFGSLPMPRSPDSPSQTPGADAGLLPPSRPFAAADNPNRLSSASVLSLDSVVGDKKSYNLQKVDPFFTDSNGEYYRAFEKRLEELNGGNSESMLCIEEYLVKSEKKWFDKFRDARLGRHSHSPAPSMFNRRKGGSRSNSPSGSIFNEDLSGSGSDNNKEVYGDEFLLGKDYVPPTGLKKWMQIRILDWPVYSIFLAFGQIIAANSYQVTLLSGAVGETASKLYAVATVYLFGSIIWWFVFRSFRSVISLTIPFFLYGIAFLIIGMAHYSSSDVGQEWVANVGTAFYSIASSSGSIFFALNFGDEGGAPVKSWVFRACVVQGTQQIYVCALWFWGASMTKSEAAGVTTNTIADSWKMTAICVPIAVFLWAIGVLMYMGLPDYYRQAPGKVPSFYRSLFRRKIIAWFFVYVVIQNFFLSAPYGRNWNFLWSSTHASTWEIVLLIFLFFVVIWGLFLCKYLPMPPCNRKANNFNRAFQCAFQRS